ncbi:putative holin-like toxin [Aneurinibacillus migulanus]|nr:putative holin-like toxin [Aneurinibacillus migulanus]
MVPYEALNLAINFGMLLLALVGVILAIATLIKKK